MDRCPNHGHLVFFHVNDPVAVTLGAFLQPGDDDLPAHEACSAFGAVGDVQVCSQLFLHDVDLLVGMQPAVRAVFQRNSPIKRMA